MIQNVPPLPPALARPAPVVLVGTTLWLLAFVVFGLRGWFDGEFGMPFWTSGAGVVLGLIGYGVFRWQQAAARRGSRGAWSGFSGTD